MSSALPLVDVLMIGSGEYTTGYGANSSKTDKSAGVVALSLLDLKARGFVGKLHLAGSSGKKMPAIREHMQRAICGTYPVSNYKVSEIQTYPRDDEVDGTAYKSALSAMPAGSAVTIFTPDDTHFEIALACIRAGMHVLVTKPIVMKLEEHAILAREAEAHNVLVAVEVHKRWDPIYTDARDRLRALGPLSYLNAYMSQPKIQLETFKAWAGISSDISYYLNSHHVDFSEWAFGDRAKPIRVAATAATGVASALLGRPCEDTISLHATWQNFAAPHHHHASGSASATAAAGGGGKAVGEAINASSSAPSAQQQSNSSSTGTAVAASSSSSSSCSSSRATSSFGTASYTASWIAPPSDVHSQQRFHCMCHRGEVTVDQAHRGYTVAVDGANFASSNPLFMKYTPSEGKFVGQLGYGYRSFEAFVLAVQRIAAGTAKPRDFDHTLATVHTTKMGTAILEAGRRSLDNGGASIEIVYAGGLHDTEPVALRP